MEEQPKKIDKRIRNVVLSLVFLILVFIISGLVTSVRMKGGFSQVTSDFVDNIVMVPIVIFLFFIFSKVIGKKSLTAMNLVPTKARMLKLFYGALIGVGMALIVYLINVWTGSMALTRIDGSISFWAGVTAYFFISLLLAFWLTLAVRGYTLNNLSDGIGPNLSAIILALVIALMRLTCPAANFIYLLGISFYILFLNYSYFYSRDIYLPLGLFFGWLWIANIFFSKTLYNVEHIHSLLSGQIKYEEGFIAMTVSIIGIVVILYLLRRRKQREASTP